MALPFGFLASKLTKLENVDRLVHTDPSGGGSIIRTFYIEPYSAYPLVLTALRGTVAVDPTIPPVGGISGYQRIKPHVDPYQSQFYCTDAKVVPMDRGAIRGCRGSGFNPSNNIDGPITDYNGQLFACRTAMNNIDDFDFANDPDILTATKIANNQQNYPVNKFSSDGEAGAFVTATYSPLIFLQGLANTLDPFDYVIREDAWTNETIITQTGRRLFVLRESAIPTKVAISGGLEDTFGKPEVIWKFRIWRLMVPFLPKFTIDLFTNKINGGTYQAVQWLGGINCLPFIACTCRLDNVVTEMMQGPDGVTWWNLGLEFSVRKLYDEYFNERDLAYEKGWISWNHHYAIPTYTTAIGINTGIQWGTGGYYPVVWNGGLFQTMGDKHPLFLADSDTDMQQIPFVKAGGALTQSLFGAPFKAGLYANQ